MRAILLSSHGGADNLFIGKRPTPVPAEGELLVDVKVTALNRADILQRQGFYPPPPEASDILGLEIAGTVSSVGPNCTGWQVGDRVFGLLSGGGYAEYALIPARMAMKIPQGLSFMEAAAVPEVFLTAFQALIWLGGLEEGHTALIHAGGSGVGTAAIQLAKAVGAKVMVTASASKHEICLQLGASEAIDYKSEDFADRVQTLTSGQGADVILDFIGAPYFEQNIRSLSVDGKLIILAFMGGRTIENVDLSSLFRKRAQIKATTLRSRSLVYKIRLTRAFTDQFLPLFQTKALRPVIDSTFNWKDVQAAHRRMEENKNVGKIVLEIS